VGPFRGMILPDRASWGDGDAVAKLCGTYEENLHAAIERAMGRIPSLIVNIGCADGYYAVGIARIAPSATVHAFDTDAHAREICTLAAKLNGVGDRIIVGGECSAAMVSKLASEADRVLVVMDCEGAEGELLEPTHAGRLENCDILAELHSDADRDIVDSLTERFALSHEVERIAQGGRDPNRVAALMELPELERWLAIYEGRAASMRWLACWARRTDPDRHPEEIPTLAVGR
jgi:hypothetical protein